jgi:hypothetical protein
MHADLVFTNGKMITVDPKVSITEAVAEKSSGIIIAHSCTQ